MTDILYLMSDTGGGHRSAANALLAAVREQSPRDVSQEIVDVFAACSRFLNFFAGLYGPTIKYFPWGWKMGWHWLHHQGRMSGLEKLAKPFIHENLQKLINAHAPKVMVSVHPMVNHLAVAARETLGLHTPLMVVITDPVTVHPTWVTPAADGVVVATEEAAQQVISYGMPADRVMQLGMPIHPKFSEQQTDRAVARRSLHLVPDRFTVLLTGGGEGAGKMDAYLRAMCATALPIQVIVVAGRNGRFQAQAASLAKTSRVPVTVYGFTDEMPRLMGASDVVISKAGPGTLFEALAMDLPIVVTSWIPGQEEGNARFVETHGVGKIATRPEQVVVALRELLQPTAYARVCEHIQTVKQVGASQKIAAHILRLVDKIQ